MPRDREAESNSRQESRHSGHRDQRDQRKDHRDQRRDDRDQRDQRRDDRQRERHSDRREHDRSNSRHDDRNHVSKIKSEPPDKGYEASANRRAVDREDREDRRRNDRQRVRDRNERSEEQQHWGRENVERQVPTESKPKEKPNMELSGKLAEDTNVFKGVVIKYNEPPEARKPKRKWRLYPFKGEEALPMLHIHRQSAFLLGRDRRIADIPIDHPSCSKQHAVLQFRMVGFERPDGTQGRRVKPYIIDLGSGNGSFVNGKQIEGQRYVELFEKDVLKFGFSSREYVIMHEGTVDDVEDDGVAGPVSPEPATKKVKKEETD